MSATRVSFTSALTRGAIASACSIGPRPAIGPVPDPARPHFGYPAGCAAVETGKKTKLFTICYNYKTILSSILTRFFYIL